MALLYSHIVENVEFPDDDLAAWFDEDFHFIFASFALALYLSFACMRFIEKK